MRLYVAGPMTRLGPPTWNFPAFEAAARHLRALGHDVVSPNEIDENEEWVFVERDTAGGLVEVTTNPAKYTYEGVLARDIEHLSTCEGIVLLDGWRASEGARMELRAAHALGLTVFDSIGEVPSAALQAAAAELGVALGAVLDAGEVRVTDPSTGGAKGSKPCQLGWVAPAGLHALGEVAGFGAGKYAPTNFRRGYRWSLSINAAMRHLLAIMDGEDLDPESGLPHAAHLAWHGCTLVQFLVDHPDLDDRYGRPADDGGDA